MKNQKLADIAVIGGSGLYDIRQLKKVREVKVRTPYGAPSDAIVAGELAGVPVAFLPRHGRAHSLLPGEINQRANIWALKSLGARTVLSVSAVGSLKEKLAPTHFVFPDHFVDQTRGRRSTFYGEGVLGHVPMAKPFCMGISGLLYRQAKKLGIRCHLGGTYICMEEPGFSTRAESLTNRGMGYDLIGMTVTTEAKLAREAGLHYAPAALVTYYDCWKTGEEVSKDLVLKNLFTNINNARRLLAAALPLVVERSCRNGCHELAAGALLTDRKHWQRDAARRLGTLLG